MNFFPPLLAAGIEVWLKIIAGIVFGSIYLINHLLSASKAQQKKAQPRPRQQLPPERPRQAVPDRPRPGAALGQERAAMAQERVAMEQERKAASGRGALDNEVNEFLRRAGQKRDLKPAATQARKTSGQPPAKLSSSSRELANRGRIAPEVPLRRQSSLDVVPVEAVQETAAAGSAVIGNLGTRVASHLDNREFAQRASHLAQVTKSEAAIQSHVHEVFDHQVGKLVSPRISEASAEDQSVGAAASRPAFAAAALADMLANPEQVRTMIIMNEILSRPTHRW